MRRLFFGLLKRGLLASKCNSWMLLWIFPKRGVINHCLQLAEPREQRAPQSDGPDMNRGRDHKNSTINKEVCHGKI